MRLPRLRDYEKWQKYYDWLHDESGLRDLDFPLPPGLIGDFGFAYPFDDFLDPAVYSTPPEPTDYQLGWELVRRRLWYDDPPRPEHVAYLVRHSAIPEDLRDYVAALIEGKVKRRPGPGRPGRLMLAHDLSDPGFLNAAAWAAWCYRVVRWKKVYARMKERRPGITLDPYAEAKAKVAQESGISEHTLDSWLYPRS